ncbi:sensor histidine kinase [Kitasatospora arboriphila]
MVDQDRHAGPAEPGTSFRNIPGAKVESRRQLLVKLCWMSLWAVYLAYPVKDLVDGHHGTAATVFGWAALGVYLACYLSLVAFRSIRPGTWSGHYALVVVMVALALVTPFVLGEAWLTLFTYASVCIAVVVPSRYSVAGVGAATAAALLVGLLVDADKDTLVAIVVPCFLSGLAMTGLQRLISTMQELREARAAVAHLAASEERLRLARDLHDLLGHSLSLITIKSELAGRFMDAGKQEQARSQVADIESVARQSLVDVREAVSGFRLPTLPVELAAARTALTTARITLEAAPGLTDARPGLDGEEAGALAWALREAVTNIVRHGTDATVCTVAMDETWEDDGRATPCWRSPTTAAAPASPAPATGCPASASASPWSTAAGDRPRPARPGLQAAGARAAEGRPGGRGDR